jgi:S-DNA-T family DNA segregation ATPase FtsK/SpoIIIE
VEGIGYEVNDFFQDYIGKIELPYSYYCAWIYLAVRFKLTPEHIIGFFLKMPKKKLKASFLSKSKSADDTSFVPLDNNLSEEAEAFKSAFEQFENLELNNTILV